MTDALLSVEDLVKEFPGQQSFVDWVARRPAHPVRAVDGISLSVPSGAFVKREATSVPEGGGNSTGTTSI